MVIGATVNDVEAVAAGNPLAVTVQVPGSDGVQPIFANPCAFTLV